MRKIDPIGLDGPNVGASSSDEARALFLRVLEAELDRSYRLAGLLLGSGAEAEDAVGDAIERAWSEASAVRDPERFRPWFDRIVVNACRDRLRRRARIKFVALDPEGPLREDPFQQVLTADAVWRAISGLPMDEREVIILHYWADLTQESVAIRLGVPTGTVKSRLHRALEHLRSMPEAAALSVEQ